jgi:hypothetical protein
MAALSFALRSIAYADTIVVAPNANARTNGSVVQFGVLGNAPVTFQTDIAASQLTSLVGETITSIGYRLPSGASSIGSVTLTGFSLELSGSTHAIGSLSTNQAANIGANAQVVDSGTLTLTGLVGGTGPNPFFLINFTTPYLYTGGDLLVTDSFSTSGNDFAVDAVPPGSLIDTSAIFNGSNSKAEFYNPPVTEFVATTSPIPEPGSVTLLGTGVVTLAGLLRKRFV